MITLITGENSFEVDRALKKIVASFNGAPEKIDGTELELKQLPDLLMGATLFAERRLVIIKDLSENKTVWAQLSEWLTRVSDDIQLVLVESKPDKRAKTYKDLHKIATIQEYKPWGERDTREAEKWVVTEAKVLGFEMNAESARLLVARVGVDQWLLFHALEKLIGADVITPALIEDIIDANPAENVFNIFEAALKGDKKRLVSMLRTLEMSEDPYRLFGLLSAQAFQLAALAVSDKPSAEVAKDLGAHPFALSKLAPAAKKIGKPGVKKIIAAFAEADDAMKTSAAEPWLLIERALMKVATI